MKPTRTCHALAAASLLAIAPAAVYATDAALALKYIGSTTNTTNTGLVQYDLNDPTYQTTTWHHYFEVYLTFHGTPGQAFRSLTIDMAFANNGVLFNGTGFTPTTKGGVAGTTATKWFAINPTDANSGLPVFTGSSDSLTAGDLKAIFSHQDLNDAAQFDQYGTSAFAEGGAPSPVGIFAASLGQFGGYSSSASMTVSMTSGANFSYFNAADSNDNNFTTASSGVTSASLSVGFNHSTWNGSVDSKWSTWNNWNSGTPNSQGASANFTGAGPAAINVDSGKVIAALTFSGNTAYTCSGSNIAFFNDGGGCSLTSSSPATQTFNCPVSFSYENAAISSTGGGILNFAGGLTIYDDGGSTVTLTASNGGVIKLGDCTNHAKIQINAAGGDFILDGTLTIVPSIMHGVPNPQLNSGTFGGHGTVAGTLYLGTSDHTIAPSATLPATSTGTLTVTTLATNSHTTFAFNLVTPAAADMINISGTNGLTLNTAKIQLNDNSAPQGYYKVIGYAGAIQGAGASSLTLLTPAPPNMAYLIDTLHDLGFIDIHKVLIGDANGDNIVDGSDFDNWLAHLSFHTTDYAAGDFNQDGLVDGADFDIWFTHLLNTAGNVSPLSDAPVPEPLSLASLLPALMLLRRRAR